MQGRLVAGNSRKAPLAAGRALTLALAAMLLAGCVDQAADLQAGASASATASAITRRPDVSPRGASLALASLDCPSPAAAARYAQALVAAAPAREISLAASAKARYVARGYVTAYAVEGGTAFEYVWDVFEAGKARAQRLSDAVVVKGEPGADAWSLASDTVLAELAGKSADDLAAFLSNTPEAAAAAKAGRPSVAAAASATKPLAYAPD